MRINHFCYLAAAVLLSQISAAHATLPGLKKIKLYSSDQTSFENRQFGAAVAATDKFAIVGEPAIGLAQPVPGRVHVFDAVTGNRVRVLSAPNDQANNGFGASLAAAGDLLLVGSDEKMTGSGRIFLFSLSTGKLLRQAGNNYGVGTGWGRSVALTPWQMVSTMPGAGSGKGGMGVESIPGMNAAGSSFAFQTAVADAGFGTALHAMGHLLLVGAPGESRVYGYQQSNQQFFLQPAGLTPADGFGRVLTGNGQEMMASASERSTGGLTANGVVFRSRPPYTTLELLAVDATPGSNRRVGQVMTSEGKILTASVNAVGGGHDLILFNLVTNAPYATIPNSALSPGKATSSLAMVSGRLLVGVPTDADKGMEAGAVWLISGLAQPEPFVTEAGKGDTAPGFSGIQFQTLGDAVLTSNERVVTRAKLTGTESNRGRDTGLYSEVGNPGWLKSVAKSRQAFGNALTIGEVLPGTIANDPMLSLIPITVTGTGVTAANRHVLLRDNGAAAATVLRTGEPVNGLNGNLRALRQVVQSSTMSRFGANLSLTVGAMGVTPATDSAIGMWTSAVFSAIDQVTEGASVPMQSFKVGEILPRVAYHSDGVVFQAALTEGVTTADNAAVFGKVQGGALMLLARKGSPAPVPNKAVTYRAFLAEGGSVARPFVRASLQGEDVTTANNEGLFFHDGSELKLVARKGTGVFGVGSSLVWHRFVQAWPMGDRLLVRGQVLDRSNRNRRIEGLFLFRENQTWQELARQDEGVSGAPGATIGAFQRIEVSPTSGHYALLVTLKGVPKAGNQALLRGDANAGSVSQSLLRQPTVILQKNTLYLNGFTGGARLLSLTSVGQASTDASGVGRKGLGHVMSSSGAILVLATFSDATTRLIRMP